MIVPQRYKTGESQRDSSINIKRSQSNKERKIIKMKKGIKKKKKKRGLKGHKVNLKSLRSTSQTNKVCKEIPSHSININSHDNNVSESEITLHCNIIGTSRPKYLTPHKPLVSLTKTNNLLKKNILRLPEIKEKSQKLSNPVTIHRLSKSPPKIYSPRNAIEVAVSIRSIRHFEGYFMTLQKQKEEMQERMSSVRKSFIEKKLHVFNKEAKTYYYVILQGNASYLIKNCMAHRSNWRECQSSANSLYNFKWQQTTIGMDYPSLSQIASIKQTVNHFEYHPSISNKSNLFKNVMKYCESHDLEIFQYLPFTILLEYDSSSYAFQQDNFTTLFNTISQFVIDYQSIANKTFKDISRKIFYNSLFPIEEKVGSKTVVAIPSSHYDNKNLWMVKACDLNRGQCIKVANSIDKVQELVKKFHEGIFKGYSDENGNPLTGELKEENKKLFLIMNQYKSGIIIVQKYIEQPLLYLGRKFDIRIWVIITHKFEVYVFKEGHLKTCSVPYNLDITDTYAHITNYSFQKHNQNFSRFEHGNEVSFSDFQNFVNELYSDRQIDVYQHIFSKIKEIVAITCKSVKHKLNKNERKYCFEIYGYDFMMDKDFNIFLIEVNDNPGLEESSPLIKKIIPRMLDDALRLTIDDIYETKYTFNSSEIVKDKPVAYCSPYPVQGYSNDENLWTFVCDLQENDDPLVVLRKIKKRKTFL